jgi:hypothetical protein
MAEPCTFLRAGKLSAIVGDDTERGPGGKQYSGLWSLNHASHGTGLFQAAYAGLIANTHRGTGPRLEPIDGTSARLVKDNLGKMRKVVGTYQLVEPHYVDYTYEVQYIDADQPATVEHSWCCYMNSPADSSIHFIENNVWTRYTPTFHGAAAMIHPTGLSEDRKVAFEKRTGDARFAEQGGFHESYSGRTFDYPFYMGFIHGYMFMLMADHFEDFRFFISPSGAGYSSVPGCTSPAWDFMWVNHRPRPGETRTLNVRLAVIQPRGPLPQTAWQEWETFRGLHPIK